MTDELFRLWVYLSSTPLAGLTLTLVAYAIGYAIYARSSFHPIANPVPIAVAVVGGAAGPPPPPPPPNRGRGQFVHFLLGPAVVGLAVPLAREWRGVRRLAFPIAASLVVGSVVAATSAVAIAWALGVSPATLASLVPKSVTAPVAMGIAERIGGLPALAAVFAVATGVVGAVLGRYVFDAAGVSDLRARGFALGLAAHGIGTARAFQVDRDAGTYAGLAFGLHALAAALAMPLAVAAWRALAG